jgi:hypothetical protein
VPVAHAYNPNYSGGRDQEDFGSKPAWANCSVRPYLKEKKKKKNHKKGLVEWLKVKALSSNPSTRDKKNLKGVFRVKRHNPK